MGREPTYPAPKKSEKAVDALKGGEIQIGEDVDFLSFFALIFTALGAYFMEPAFGLAGMFMLISIIINQKPNAPLLSNGKISLFLAAFCTFMIYKKKYDL